VILPSDQLQESFFPNTTFPVVIEPRNTGIQLSEWLLRNRDLVESWLLKVGAVLFRGFSVDSVEKFDTFVRTGSDKPMKYVERSSPRSQLGQFVYTSTDYPARRSIFLHNEHSYAGTFPLRLFFCCQTPANSGGQTPMADCRRVLRRIPAEIQQRFHRKRWMYVRNFSLGIGLPWTTAFQTQNRCDVEEYCINSRIEFEWKTNDELQTRQVRSAIARHPRTGEEVWFNHVAFFHLSTLEEPTRSLLLQNFAVETLPNNTYYGDGTPIDDATLDIVREAYRQETISFDWQRGDAVVVDNMLVAHSRTPYTGERRILFAMAEPTDQDEVAL
jgi:alpha-ketoglutarate-dependent taurine dioxygenase